MARVYCSLPLPPHRTSQCGRHRGKEAEKLYTRLTSLGLTVLYDDRLELSAGERFTDADLLGVPTRLVISERTLGKGVERKDRKTGSVDVVPYAVLEP